MSTVPDSTSDRQRILWRRAPRVRRSALTTAADRECTPQILICAKVELRHALFRRGHACLLRPSAALHMHVEASTNPHHTSGRHTSGQPAAGSTIVYPKPLLSSTQHACTTLPTAGFLHPNPVSKPNFHPVAPRGRSALLAMAAHSETQGEPVCTGL